MRLILNNNNNVFIISKASSNTKIQNLLVEMMNKL